MKRYTDDWLAAVYRSGASDRARNAAYACARFADWDTGGNCWASAHTLAQTVNRGRRTIQRGLEELEALGFLARTGITRPHNATDYALVAPAPGSAKVDPSSSAKVGASDLSQLRQFGPSVASDQAISSAKVGAQPPQTSSPEEEDEEEGRPASAPQGADTPPDMAAPAAPDRSASKGRAQALAPSVVAALRDRWKDDGLSINGSHVRGLQRLIDAGWTEGQILDAVTQSGRPRSNPSGMLTAHLTRLLDHDPEDYALVDVAASVWRGIDAARGRKREEALAHPAPAKCAHGRREELLTLDLTNCPACHAEGRIIHSA